MNTGLYVLLGFLGGCFSMMILLFIIAVLFSLKDKDGE